MRPFHERVTVVILTYNRVTEVTRTVEQVRRLPEHPAIIIVDNGSSDGTPQLLTSRFPDVEVIRCDTNRGAAARNIGIQTAHTPYVALCEMIPGGRQAPCSGQPTCSMPILVWRCSAAASSWVRNNGKIQSAR